MNAFKVAADANDKLFVATSCCVQAVKNVWNDKMHPDHDGGFGRLPIVIGFLSFGLLAPPFVRYREVSVSSRCC